jgi:hypothetical protein
MELGNNESGINESEKNGCGINESEKKKLIYK